MKSIYRISDAGYSKVKPYYIGNFECLANFMSIFKDVEIIADNCSDQTLELIYQYFKSDNTRKDIDFSEKKLTRRERNLLKLNEEKNITEGQALFLIIAIFFGGTFLLNAIVYGFIGNI